MEAAQSTHVCRAAICLKIKDVPASAYPIHIDIGEDISIYFSNPPPTPIPDGAHAPLKCWTCKRPGHFSRQCLSDGEPLHNACFECGASDHHAWQCQVPLRSPLHGPWNDTFVCKAHNKCRGKFNVFKLESGGWQCKPDSPCSDLA